MPADREIITHVFHTLKGRTWQAKSTVPLGLDPTEDGELRLRLNTYADKRAGCVVTRATVVHCKGALETHKMFSDYSGVPVTHSCMKRGTENAIRTAHSIALNELPGILELARAHYAA